MIESPCWRISISADNYTTILSINEMVTKWWGGGNEENGQYNMSLLSTFTYFFFLRKTTRPSYSKIEYSTRSTEDPRNTQVFQKKSKENPRKQKIKNKPF
jgi:hypothetical protein